MDIQTLEQLEFDPNIVGSAGFIDTQVKALSVMLRDARRLVTEDLSFESNSPARLKVALCDQAGIIYLIAFDEPEVIWLSLQGGDYRRMLYFKEHPFLCAADSIFQKALKCHLEGPDGTDCPVRSNYLKYNPYVWTRAGFMEL